MNRRSVYDWTGARERRKKRIKIAAMVIFAALAVCMAALGIVPEIAPALQRLSAI